MKSFNSEIEYRNFVLGLKREQKIGKVLFWIGWIFWLIETVTFTIIHGWHIGAINSIEEALDTIAWIIMCIGIYLILRFTYRTSKFFMETMLPPEIPKQSHYEKPNRHSDN